MSGGTGTRRIRTKTDDEDRRASVAWHLDEVRAWHRITHHQHGTLIQVGVLAAAGLVAVFAGTLNADAKWTMVAGSAWLVGMLLVIASMAAGLKALGRHTQRARDKLEIYQLDYERVIARHGMTRKNERVRTQQEFMADRDKLTTSQSGQVEGTVQVTRPAKWDVVARWIGIQFRLLGGSLVFLVAYSLAIMLA